MTPSLFTLFINDIISLSIIVIDILSRASLDFVNHL
jgi:hypothetical protein